MDVRREHGTLGTGAGLDRLQLHLFDGLAVRHDEGKWGRELSGTIISK